MPGGGEGGGIVGDGPLIDEVYTQKSLLSTTNQLKFEAVYNKYKTDEDSVTEGEILFVLDCGKVIVKALNG
jgi:hypothetical protein